MAEPIIAGVELGGTKAIAVLAQGRRVLAEERRPTREPAATLPEMAALVAGWARDHPVAALGIAAFGPLDLAAGRVARTVKPGWSGADLVGPFARLGLPVALDTDVNAAALAEHRWGAGVGEPVLAYLTIGTGLGGGVLVDGRAVHGAMHPELGHLTLRRATGDGFAGACAFHGDCVEGLVSGPALAARFGRTAPPFDPADPRWAAAAFDLGQLFAALVLTVSPTRILVGGGVGLGEPAFVAAAARAAAGPLAGYLPGFDPALVRPAGLGPQAGPLGAIALGLDALGRG